MKRFLSPETNSKFRKYFREPALRSLKRESVSRAVAVGIFAAFIPVMPFQMLLAVVLGIVLRANLAIAVALSWINNPVTLLPIAYFVSGVGRFILNEDQSTVQTVIKEFEWKFGLTDQSYFTSWIVQFGKEYFVGLPVVAIGFAVIGYLLVDLGWWLYLFFQKKS